MFFTFHKNSYKNMKIKRALKIFTKDMSGIIFAFIEMVRKTKLKHV